MPEIKVFTKDGKTKVFQESNYDRYVNSIRYEGVFAVITDSYGKQTSIPAENIDCIEVESTRPRSW